MKKVFLLPFFGEYPTWLDQWVANMENLDYDYKIFSNKKIFEERVYEKLEIEPNVVSGEAKVWDYRPALGYLYEDVIKDYDVWGHTDFDCVYGDVDKYMPEDFEIWSNHHNYIMGAWTLYKNTDKINTLFKKYALWKESMEDPTPNGWGEENFAPTINHYANVVYTHHQTKDLNDFSTLSYKDGKLYEGDKEVMMAHFRRTKVYPVGRDEI